MARSALPLLALALCSSAERAEAFPWQRLLREQPGRATGQQALAPLPARWPGTAAYFLGTPILGSYPGEERPAVADWHSQKRLGQRRPRPASAGRPHSAPPAALAKAEAAGAAEQKENLDDGTSEDKDKEKKERKDERQTTNNTSLQY